jgi:hypothetical protein
LKFRLIEVAIGAVLNTFAYSAAATLAPVKHSLNKNVHDIVEIVNSDKFIVDNSIRYRYIIIEWLVDCT